MSTFITDEEAEIRKILVDARVIAVVGASESPFRDSNMIMRYLIEQGYDVVPVNPKYEKVLDRQCFPTVKSTNRQVDIVNVFRRSEYVEEVAHDAIASKAGTLWLQLGVKDEDAARYAANNGAKVVMDRCIMVEHRRLIGSRNNRA